MTSADHFDRAAGLLREAAREIEQAGSQRIAVRVLHTGDGWQPPPEPVHTCTDACTDGVCKITEAELRKAHWTAEERVEWLRTWWPLDATIPDPPTGEDTRHDH